MLWIVALGLKCRLDNKTLDSSSFSCEEFDKKYFFLKPMKTPSLDFIKKQYKKHHKNWTDEEIDLKSNETLNNYLASNSERIEREIQESKEKL